MFKKISNLFKFLVFFLLIVIFALPEVFKSNNEKKNNHEPIALPNQQTQPHIPHGENYPRASLQRGNMFTVSATGTSAIVKIFDEYLKN